MGVNKAIQRKKMIKFFCQHCQQKLSIEKELAGTSLLCPVCENPVTVPPLENHLDDSAETFTFTFQCPHCEQKLSAEHDHNDMTINCPSCFKHILIDAITPSSDSAFAPTSTEPQSRKEVKRNSNRKIRHKKSASAHSKTKRKKNKGSLVFPSILVTILLIMGFILFNNNVIKDKLNSKTKPTELSKETEAKASSFKNPVSTGKQTFTKPFVAEAPVNHQLVKHVKTFMKKYCIECHNPKKEKGGLLLHDLDYSLAEHNSVYIWQDVLEVLNGGEMPPEDEKQPQDEELKNAIAEITDSLQKAKQRLASTGGVIKMRHLNKREYYASIKDLFGYEPPGDYLFDDVAPSFDTNGNDQFFTSASLENYLAIGKKIAHTNLDSYSKPIKKNTSYREFPGQKMYTSMEKKLKVALATKKKIEGGATFKEMGYKDEARLTQEKRRCLKVIETAKAYLAKPEHKFGATGEAGASARVEGGQDYKITIRAGSLKKTSTPIKIKLKIMSTHYGTVKLKPTGDKTQEIELPYKSGDTTKRARIRATLLSGPGTYIESFEIKGSKRGEPSFAEKLFRPILSEKNVSTEKASQAIRSFAERAFRYQQGNDEFIDAVVDRFKKNQSLSKEKTIENLAKSFSLILTSPSFLYIAEKNNGQRNTISQHEYAIRLAYFLWGSPPDEELYKTARTGKLYDFPVLKKQFDRMLNSPKANVFLTSFINQWLDMRRFDQIDLPTEFEGPFRGSARAELSEFFKVLIHENLPADNLIASDFAVINDPLAEHYGLSDDFDNLGQEFQKIKLKPSHNRGGMLSQAAFLIMGSSGERTSPTIRGTIVRTILLNDPPPAPPANVPEIEDTKDGVVSVKELVEHHKSLPQCSSCHDKIDPIGLGLENFDLFGKWRKEEKLRVGAKKRRNTRYKNFPLDTTGYLSDNEQFSSFRGLQQALLKNKDKLAESLYSSMLSYGIGRSIEFIDQGDIHHNLKILAQDNFPVRDMLFRVITSNTFKTK